MLPTGHIEFTWAALNLLQRKSGLFRDADYRLVGLAALAPDLLDKPLALTAYRDSRAALFWGHNLWLHMAVWLAVAAWARASGGRASGISRLYAALPHLMAFSGHLVADRMWGFQESLFYPLGAGHWHPWVHVGAPTDMLAAYLEVIRTTPLLVAFEAVGLGLLAWWAWDRQLWRRGVLAGLVRAGRFPAGDPSGVATGGVTRRLEVAPTPAQPTVAD